MSVTTPVLDLILVDTHSSQSIGFGDFSQYPQGFNIVSPTLQVVAPGYPSVSLTFQANSVNIYTSNNFGITPNGTPLQPLPDGVYNATYSINPSYEYYVTRTFIRVDGIMETFNTAFMKLDMMECDGPIRRERMLELDTIYYYIQGAIAAANKCAPDLATNMYRKANKMLANFVKNKCNCNAYNKY
jgi:hypothetical protein